jgi:hypothetical protein
VGAIEPLERVCKHIGWLGKKTIAGSTREENSRWPEKKTTK